MTHSFPPTPPRSPSPARPLDTDSIFGSSRSASPDPLSHLHLTTSNDDTTTATASHTNPSQAEPRRPRRPELSNLPAVRRQHTTTGYRAGLSAGRDDPVTAQAGFDEGYPVGAALGMRAGYLLAMRRAMRRAETLRGSEGGGDGGGGGTVEKMGRVDKGNEGEDERIERELGLEALVTDMQVRGVLGREPTAEELDVPAVEANGGEWRLEGGWLEEIAALREEGKVVDAWCGRVGASAQA